MKNLFKIICAFTVLFFAFLCAAKYRAEIKNAALPEERPANNGASADKNVYVSHSAEEFLVLQTETGGIISMSDDEYVIGALFAEMPADYPDEALRAQALAAKTYAVRRREEEILRPTAELMGAYISDDFSKYPKFLTEEEARDLYGDSYEKAFEKISAAANAVSDKVIVFDGEPIIAVFHAVSAGKTESAEELWGESIPYLISADSAFDESSPDFYSSYSFTEAEVRARLSAFYNDESMKLLSLSELRIAEKSSVGSVLFLSFGEKTVSGSDFRTIFSLSSANFTFSYPEDGVLTVDCKGRGNGVGLSQYGAKELALAGHTYEDIIRYYYNGADICELCFESDDT